MKLLKLKRTFAEGWKNVVRNGWLSFATTSVLVLSLYVMSVTIVIGIVGQASIRNLEKNINISVYFNDETAETDILALKAQMEKASDIVSVRYVTPSEALDQLMKTQKDNPEIKKALDAIGRNPLPASLVIRAADVSQYAPIVEKLEKSSYAPLISDINYRKNKDVIDRFSRIVATTQKIGLTLGIVFLLISALITYNTVRLTLYSRKQEFEIMRLVGASNVYIKMPSLVEGVCYGAFASLATLILLFLTIQYVASLVNTQGAADGNFLVRMFLAAPTYFGVENVKDFYLTQLWKIAFALLGSGVLLGALSSWIAIKRYLKA